jgi:hypothetical protein
MPFLHPKGLCQFPNNVLTTVQCENEEDEVAFVKFTRKSEFKRFLSNGTEETLHLIWQSDVLDGGIVCMLIARQRMRS